MACSFLLLETRELTNLSLLFGSTWYVGAAVFAGVLLPVLAANIAVARLALGRPWPAPLWWFDVGVLNRLAPLSRGITGGLLTALPVGFAGVIVSILLARSPHPAGALGSNLLGAVVGGCLECLSMLFGLRALELLAAGCYLVAAAFTFRGRRAVNGSSPFTSAGAQAP